MSEQSQTQVQGQMQGLGNMMLPFMLPLMGMSNQNVQNNPLFQMFLQFLMLKMYLELQKSYAEMMKAMFESLFK